MLVGSRALIEHLDRVYAGRRDRYGLTLLSRSRAIRVIRLNDDEAVRRIVDVKLLDSLASAGSILPAKLIRGRQSRYVFLAQKRICPVAVPSEWSPTMFADAALLILRTERLLIPLKMTVDDPHPWNVLFNCAKPYIVDMGSFNVIGTSVHWSGKRDAEIWPAFDVFCAFFLNAVTLVAAGRTDYISRTFTDWNPLPGSDTALLLFKRPAVLFAFLSFRLKIAGYRWFWRFSTSFRSEYLSQRLRFAYNSVQERFVKRMLHWTLRQQEKIGIADVPISAPAAEAVTSFTKENSASSVLIYTRSRRSVEIVSDLVISKLLVLSPDANLIEALYQARLDRMTTAVIDLRSPTAGVGPCNRWATPSFERFRSEVGIFFFALDELVLEKCLTLTELLESSHALSRKALILLKKPNQEIAMTGRDYGQLGDAVIFACLEQRSIPFQIIYNNKEEIAVVCGNRP